MKKIIAFVILYSFLWILWTFVILCQNTQAQWEGAQIQQLTDDDLPNRMACQGLYIDDNDKLYLFYLEGVRDTITGFVYDYRIFYITKEKDGGWSQPEEIQTSTYIFGQGRHAGLWMDTKTGIIHILYSSLAGDIYDDTLYYTNSNIPDWEFVKIDSLPGAQNHAQYFSYKMDFDSLGNVHLVWHLDFDSASYHWYRVIYTNNSTGEWAKQVISPPICVGYGRSGRPFLCVQKNGTAHNLYGTDWLCYYTRNDSLNSENWKTDTIPRPPHPLYTGPLELLADAGNRIHLFMWGCSSFDCDTSYSFYYYKQSEDSIWTGPEEVQVFPPDSGRIREYFIDKEDQVHLSLTTPGGFSVFYTNNKNGGWLDPLLLLYEYDAVGAGSSFKFVMDSQGRGHGVFIGYKYHGGIPEDDSTEVYYFTSTTSVEDTLQDHKIFSFQLFQNYPNPFNAVTRIQYAVGSRQSHPIHTTLKIYNILGKEVRELVNTKQGKGCYQVIWDGMNNSGKEVASGIYFYQLKAGNFTETKKLVLIK